MDEIATTMLKSFVLPFLGVSAGMIWFFPSFLETTKQKAIFSVLCLLLGLFISLWLEAKR
jgi:hypothetical protein